jgi:predicted permease
VITGILFGLAPALRATRFDLVPALKDTVGIVRMGRSRIKLDKVLVVAQVALSLFLLIGAGLFTRSLENLRNIDFGFNPDNLLLFTLDTKPGYKPEQRINLYKEVLARLQTLPGVTSSSMSNYGLLGGSYINMTVSVAGFTPTADEDTTCNAISVGPRFFETMNVPLLIGRSFNSGDNVPVPDESPDNPNTISTPALQIVVINETMAKYFFPNENPIGKQFGFGGPPGMEIIGVVKDSKSVSLREPPTRVFYSPYFRDNIDQGGTFAVRTTNNPALLSATIQQAVREIDKGAEILNVQTMQDVIDHEVVQERFIAQVAGFFGLFAVLLACIGLYGVMSYGVVRRTREIGIRMALGARASGVVWFVMRESVLLVLIGVAIGVPAALATTRFVATYLFGLSATDPVTIVAASVLLLSVALLAGYLPSRRASRIDPMVALRYD